MTLRLRFIQLFIIPYIRRELPAWGKLYQLAIGDYKKDHRWKNVTEITIQGKLHKYFMRLDIRGWSNRATWALGRFYDLGTQLVVSKLLRPGDLFVDIGANEGMISLVAARSVGSDGKVIAFEPNPVPRAKFEKNLELNIISTVNIIAAGASDQEGTLELFVPEINTGEGSFAHDGNHQQPGTVVACPIITGDSVLKDANPSLIKIDVEGFEGKVILGLSATISRTDPIIIMEMVETHLLRAGWSPAKLSNQMSELNYVGMRIEIAGRFAKKLKLSPLKTSDWIDCDVLWIPTSKLSKTLYTVGCR